MPFLWPTEQENSVLLYTSDIPSFGNSWTVGLRARFSKAFLGPYIPLKTQPPVNS